MGITANLSWRGIELSYLRSQALLSSYIACRFANSLTAKQINAKIRCEIPNKCYKYGNLSIALDYTYIVQEVNIQFNHNEFTLTTYNNATKQPKGKKLWALIIRNQQRSVDDNGYLPICAW
jgi:hypothetical protein